MKVLVIGKGGREHALVWKLLQSPQVDEVFCAPGNAGTARGATNVAINPEDVNDPKFSRMIGFARQEQIDLTVVGPEAPLVAGMVDAFQAAGLTIFGPSRAAARLEGSKVFAKETMRQASIPTADYQVFRTAEEAERYLWERDDEPMVVKADGLAAGKGVVVCSGRDSALDAVRRIMRQREFGAAGTQVVIEDKLEGEELSVLAIIDGRTIVTLESAQDHKRAYDNDEGPNTGGMGAYSPSSLLTPQLAHQIEETILVPLVHAMKRARTPFRGVLYAGLMLTRQGPKVLEFNVRFGDPEAQPLLMRLKSDLTELILACCAGRLEKLEPLDWDPRPCVCVVQAAEGYPGAYMKGKRITGLEQVEGEADVQVFHAGTKLEDNHVVTDGGRVLGITALGESLAVAKRRAYETVRKVRFSGAWCRHDIGDKEIYRQ